MSLIFTKILWHFLSWMDSCKNCTGLWFCAELHTAPPPACRLCTTLGIPLNMLKFLVKSGSSVVNKPTFLWTLLQLQRKKDFVKICMKDLCATLTFVTSCTFYFPKHGKRPRLGAKLREFLPFTTNRSLAVVFKTVSDNTVLFGYVLHTPFPGT